jgi:hypothetical protein
MKEVWPDMKRPRLPAGIVSRIPGLRRMKSMKEKIRIFVRRLSGADTWV